MLIWDDRDSQAKPQCGILGNKNSIPVICYLPGLLSHIDATVTNTYLKGIDLAKQEKTFSYFFRIECQDFITGKYKKKWEIFVFVDTCKFVLHKNLDVKAWTHCCNSIIPV